MFTGQAAATAAKQHFRVASTRCLLESELADVIQYRLLTADLLSSLLLLRPKRLQIFRCLCRSKAALLVHGIEQLRVQVQFCAQNVLAYCFAHRAISHLMSLIVEC